MVATGRLYYLLEAGAKVTMIAPRSGLTDEVKWRIEQEDLVDKWENREWDEAVDSQEEFLTGIVPFSFAFLFFFFFAIRGRRG